MSYDEHFGSMRATPPAPTAPSVEARRLDQMEWKLGHLLMEVSDLKQKVAELTHKLENAK